MRPRLVRGLVAGWVVLAVAGWGFTQWVGEPAATPGPARVVPPASGAEPGPQPESDCAAAAARGAGRPPGPGASSTPAPGASSTPTQRPVPVPDLSEPWASGPPANRAPVGPDGQARLSQVVCDRAVYESP